MKMQSKLVVVLMLAALLVGTVPTEVSAITQSQISSLVQIVCPDQYGNYYSGSGTLIGSNGAVLTNRHVVMDEFEATIPYCVVGLTVSADQPPKLSYVAKVSYVSQDQNIDAAVLFIQTEPVQTFPYFDVFNNGVDSVQLGSNLDVVGYPGIGGSTLTYTTGQVAGYYGNYFKTTTPIDHGNSGGAAYTDDGKFVGVPTFVVRGELSSLSYILSISSIKSWLASVLGVNYATLIEGKVNQQPTTPSVLSTAPRTNGDVTAPEIWRIPNPLVYYGLTDPYNTKSPYWYDHHDAYTPVSIFSEQYFAVQWDLSGMLAASPDTKDLYIYFGKDINGNPQSGNRYDAKNFNFIPYSADQGEGIYYLIMQVADASGNFSDKVIWKYNYLPSYISSGLGLPSSLKIYSNDKKGGFSALKDYKSGDQLSEVVVPENSVYIEWFYDKDIPFEIEGQRLELFYKNLSGQIVPVTYTNTINCGLGSCESAVINYTSQNSTGFNNLEQGKHYFVKYTIYFKDNNGVHQTRSDYVLAFIRSSTVNAPAVSANSKLSNRLLGRILIQTQQHGEAWYVNPADGKRYYMKDGSVAYNMMRSFGLGITDTDLFKIPAVDDEQAMKSSTSVCSSNSSANKLKGKILLQVQQHGEAWYIHPDKCRRIYMKDGGIAYQIMRFLSLGITDADLTKIPEGSL